MNDKITAWIRTTVPMLIGALLTWLAKTYEIVLDAETTATVATAATFAVSVAWYTLSRALEARWPRLGVLLGVARPPVYGETEKAVRARLQALAELPLPEYQAAVAANPAQIPSDERDGCTGCDDHDGHATTAAGLPIRPVAVESPFVDEYPPPLYEV